MFNKRALLKKIRTVAVLAAVVAVVAAARLLFGGHGPDLPSGAAAADLYEAVGNERLEAIRGSGLVRVAENERFELFVDVSDGNIEVLDKADGYVWRSKPTPEDMEQDASNNLWKNNMRSPIMLEFVKTYTETVPTYANAYTPNTKVTVYKLADGARAYYEFTDRGISMAVDYHLRNDHLEVVVPGNLVKEAEDNWTTNAKGQRVLSNGNNGKIVGYGVLPFFGAVQRHAADDDGYLFVPDGPGALIRFSQHKRYNAGFTAPVYGSDLSYANKFDASLSAQLNQPKAYFPAFGVRRDGRAVLAVVHGGESGAEIIANPAGVTTSFYHAYPRFTYRERYKKLTDLTGAGVLQYTDFSVNASRSVKYYFLAGEQADYAGMAGVYRGYLMEERGLSRREPEEGGLPLELYIFGGTKTDGFLFDSFLPMTTFAEAEGLIEYFHGQGVGGMNIVYSGWAKGGAAVQYPNRFPAEPRLGGASGLERFMGKARALGYRVLLQDDHTRAYTSKGLSARNDLVRNMLNTPLDIGESGERVHVLNAAAMQRLLTESLTEYGELGADGLMEEGLDVLSTDFNPNLPSNRELAKRAYQDAIAQTAEKLGAIRVRDGMAYQLMQGVSIADIANEQSYSPVVDEIVPFYHIALHGLVDYVSQPYNTMDEPAYELLKAIEYGSNVSFIVTREPTQSMRNADDRLYSSEFDLWKEDILHLFGKVRQALGDVAHLFMTGHERLANDVYKTTYENGKEVIVNYSDVPYVYGGISVGPMDFMAVEGRDER